MTQKILLALLLLVSPIIAPAQTTSPINQALSKVKSDNGLSIDFSIETMGSDDAGSGTYYAHKNMFYLETSELKAWYNGRELWIYLYSNGEINLSHPTTSEIIDINPLIGLSQITSKEYKLSSKNTPSGHNITAVPLKPNVTPIEMVSIWGDKKEPLKTIEIKEKGLRQKIKIQIKAIKQNIKIDQQLFSYTPDKEPNIEIIDLR
ncbi:LolA-like putative outer membrane lipoprotein chaperone [Porphyromonas sp.]|uniref:LolA-like putative outer membrane lipoprotein chaperone n=1 Tax=Porphyromonas sp. TaxID=1924944 RepID=UPI0026DBCFEA|nr:LolA-like putative outer membrane lipoprotein chaperone [Porphyromonas sp.]MDO4695151.1 LolA-like putative outer membrane lipoprotein chaperone [Porphyromonas sp.]MDO4770205.1 LolA-like putative outer membrane lipoprotein chaperone [Porphyromonas sp.]